MQIHLGVIPPVNFHFGTRVYKPDNLSPTGDSSCFAFMHLNVGAFTSNRLGANLQNIVCVELQCVRARGPPKMVGLSCNPRPRP
eukprot:2352701-Lingulodinium_polyedra.AAC.1